MLETAAVYPVFEDPEIPPHGGVVWSNSWLGIMAPTIAEKFNTYRFADYQEKVIDLLRRVTTVSVGTMEVVREMEKAER